MMAKPVVFIILVALAVVAAVEAEQEQAKKTPVAAVRRAIKALEETCKPSSCEEFYGTVVWHVNSKISHALFYGAELSEPYTSPLIPVTTVGYMSDVRYWQIRTVAVADRRSNANEVTERYFAVPFLLSSAEPYTYISDSMATKLESAGAEDGAAHLSLCFTSAILPSNANVRLGSGAGNIYPNNTCLHKYNPSARYTSNDIRHNLIGGKDAVMIPAIYQFVRRSNGHAPDESINREVEELLKTFFPSNPSHRVARALKEDIAISMKWFREFRERGRGALKTQQQADKTDLGAFTNRVLGAISATIPLKEKREEENDAARRDETKERADKKKGETESVGDVVEEDGEAEEEEALQRPSVSHTRSGEVKEVGQDEDLSDY